MRPILAFFLCLAFANCHCIDTPPAALIDADHTDVREANGEKTIYYYSANKNPIYIEHFDRDKLYRTERLFWDTQGNLTSQAYGDGKGNIWMCRLFAYDVQGNVVRETLVAHPSSEGPIPLALESDGTPLTKDAETHNIYYTYSDTSPILLLSQAQDNGTVSTLSYDNKFKRLSSQITSDAKGEYRRHFYFYDNSGSIVKMITDNGHSENPSDLSHVTDRRTILYSFKQILPDVKLPEIIEEKMFDPATGVEKTHRKMQNRYSRTGTLLHQEIFDASGKVLFAFHYDKTGMPIPRNKVVAAKEFVGSLYDALSRVASAIQEGSLYLQQLSYSEHDQHDLDMMAEGVLGAQYLAMSGYYSDILDTGTYGQHEFGQHVRVTAINGILNLRTTCIDTIDKLSSAHGGINIHYVFSPTEGWIVDIVNAIMAQFGYVSPQAKLLAKTWKRLINEMGGIKSGGTIVHYAHSIGGTNTEIAKHLLTAEEQKMIKVITVGSATLIPNEGFAEVWNYVSKRDGVTWISSPLSAFWSLIDPNSNVIHIGSYWGCPAIDHLMDMDTYVRLIEKLGEQFVEKHSLGTNNQR